MDKAFNSVLKSLAKDILPILSGFVIWLLFILIKIPFSVFRIDYLEILILAAPLWLIPIFIKRISKVGINQISLVAAALLLSGSFLIIPSKIAAFLTIPWFLSVMVLAAKGTNKFLLESNRSISTYLRLASFYFLLIGAFWAFVHRLGFNFMGFDHTIILLTVAHFHYAGFLLPNLAALALEETESTILSWAGMGVLFGIPLLAIGITATEFGFTIYFEMVCALIMAGSAALVGIFHIVVGMSKFGWAKILFTASGICLLIGMGLAICYGLRPIFTISFLSIPFMYAVHGTLNALGFALPGVLAWAFFSK